MCVLYGFYLILRASGCLDPGFRLIIVPPFYDPLFLFYPGTIQVCHMEPIFLLHPFLDLLICSLALGGGQIHFIHISLYVDMIFAS